MCRFVFKTSVRSWSTGAWMIFTWSLAVNTATTEPGGCCHNLIPRKGGKLKEKINKIRNSGGKEGQFWDWILRSNSAPSLESFWKPSPLHGSKGKFLCILKLYYIIVSTQIVAIVSCLFVVVSTLCLIFSTLPAFQQKDGSGETSRKWNRGVKTATFQACLPLNLPTNISPCAIEQTLFK